MRILLFQKLIPHYRVELFKKLYLDHGIITCHSKGLKGSSNKSHFKELDYNTEFLPSFYYQKKETSLIQNIFPALRKYKPDIVITEFSFKYLTFWVLFIMRSIYKYRLILWCHGISNKEQNKQLKSIRSKISLAVYRKADAVIVYSYRRADVLKEYIHPGKIFIAPNTINLDKNLEIQNKLSVIGKAKLKEELGYKEKYHLVYSGRLTKVKRIDLLIEVFKILKKKTDIALHIIGSGSGTKELKEAEREIGNIYLYGEIFDEEQTGRLIYASDIMVITGAVGLSILHAFSLSIPLVAFKAIKDDPPHGPEIELLNNYQNGILSEKNTTSMATDIYNILSDQAVLKTMQENAFTTAKENTIDNMLSGFKKAIEYLGYVEKNDTCVESAEL